MRIPSRFVAVASVLVVSLAGATLASAADSKATRGLRFPSLTPDGKTVVFAWRGDIWRAPTAGGAAARLTIHEAQDTKPRVSPDGKWIAFSSKRTGNYDVFVMPVDGGEPRQLTFNSGADVATDWSPDGKRLLITSSREPSEYGLDVYEIDVAGGPPRRVTRDGGRDAAYAPDGKTIVYTRGFNTIFQDGYRGSANYDLFVTDVTGALPRRLTSTAWNEMNPCFSSDGSTVYYLAESKGKYNVFSIPAAGGEGKAVTSWTDDHARRAALGWDRKTLAVEKDGRLYTVDLTASDPKSVAIAITVESDVRNSGFDSRTVTEGAEHVCVSADGTRLAVAVRGDLWLMPATGGEAERVTSGPETDDWPRLSPDGRKLLYHSDAKGNDDVYVMDLQTKESKPLTKSAQDDAFASWAPDGKRIVYSSQKSGNKDLYVLDTESGEERQVTRDPKDDDDAVFSPDGSQIAFDSGRSGTQAIWVMSSAGNDAQARRVTSGAGFYQVPSFSPDGSMLVFEEIDPSNGSSQGVWAVKTSGGPMVQLSRDGSAPFWSPRGEWIYFSAERDGEKGIYRVRAPQAIETGERVPFLARVSVDRRREFGDLFDEAWRKLKDGFYDSSMHGVDWNALRDKYRPLALDAEIKDEFYNVVSQMLGELNASHLGIYGASDDEDAAPKGPSTGYLGLELEATVAEGGGKKVAFVQPEGPADEAGLRVGDVVKSIAGTALKAETDVDKLLAGTSGKEVAVAFAKGDGSGDRTAKVKATSEGALNQLRYKRWVEASKKTVEKKTKGEAGYIHLSQMDPTNLGRFNTALAELNQNRKVKGLVLDVRNNGGGNIHQQLLAALAAKPFIAFEPRGQSRQSQPQLHWSKPVVLLINERSFSDAEVFPYGFKQLKLGKVVGVPTAGGVIGTNDITLSDGSKFRIPRVGWYGLNGENLEHLGVKPDVVVEESPEDRRLARDPQLDKAIEVLLADIHPPAATPTKPDESKPAVEPPKVEASKGAEPSKPDASKPATEPSKPATEPSKPAVAPEATKPAEPTKPVETPTRPAETPAKPEAPKPGEPSKPTDAKPAEAPAPSEPEKPADAPAVHVATDFVNPLHDARVGEWVRIRLSAGSAGERTYMQTVTAVTDTEVEITVTLDGEDASRSTVQREKRAKDLSFRGERDGDDRHQTVTAANGKEIDCLVVTLKTRRGTIEKRYLSNAIPVRGVLRVERDGRTVSEVIDWGEKSGGADAPAK